MMIRGTVGRSLQVDHMPSSFGSVNYTLLSFIPQVSPALCLRSGLQNGILFYGIIRYGMVLYGMVLFEK